MLNFIIWMLVGALIGWAASIIIRTNNRRGLIADMLVGIVGAFVRGYFLSPLFNAGTINERERQHPGPVRVTELRHPPVNIHKVTS